MLLSFICIETYPNNFELLQKKIFNYILKGKVQAGYIINCYMLVCLATYFIRKSCKDAMCPSWSAFSDPIIWLTILGLLFALIHKDCMYIFISSLTDDLLFLYEIFELNVILILIYRFIFQKTRRFIHVIHNNKN